MPVLVSLMMVPQCALAAACQSDAALSLVLKPSPFQPGVGASSLSAFFTFAISSDLTLYLKSYHKHHSEGNASIVSAVTPLQHRTTCIACDTNHSVTQTCFDRFSSLPSGRTA